MISSSLDFTPIATWETADVTYVVQVATVQELPTSILVGHEGPGCTPTFAMQRTDRSLAELVEFWNSGSISERTAAAVAILGVASLP